MATNIISAFEHDGKIVVDSRLIAARLGIQHESFYKTIRKYQNKIESVPEIGHIRFESGTVTNSVGAVNEVKFALLTESQATILMTLSRNTDPVIQCKIKLVNAFEKAKKLLSQQSTKSDHKLSWFFDRIQVFRKKTKIPVGYFCIFEEIIFFVAEIEESGYKLLQSVIPDISVGKCWCNQLRKDGFDMELIKSYPHFYPGRSFAVDANIYPVEWLPKFRMWFEDTYKPLKSIAYFQRSHPQALPSLAKVLGLPEAQ